MRGDARSRTFQDEPTNRRAALVHPEVSLGGPGANGRLGLLKGCLCANPQDWFLHILRSCRCTAAAGCDAPSSARSDTILGDEALLERAQAAVFGRPSGGAFSARHQHDPCAISNLDHSQQPQR